MLGPDYSTKFSPWLASGSISPRFIYEEVENYFYSLSWTINQFTNKYWYLIFIWLNKVKRYEIERLSNSSTYWYTSLLPYGHSMFLLVCSNEVMWEQIRIICSVYWFFLVVCYFRLQGRVNGKKKQCAFSIYQNTWTSVSSWD